MTVPSPTKKRASKRLVAGVVLVLLAALLPLAAACGTHQVAAATADPVAATVNGRPVRRSEVALMRLEARFEGQTLSAAQALQQAIDRELIRQEATRLGVAASPSEVAAATAALTSQLGGAGALDAALKGAGMTAAQLHLSLTDGVLSEAVQNAKFPGLAAGAAAVRAYYNQHRATTFAVPASVNLSVIVVASKGIAENALTRLRQGHSFTEVAMQFSIDVASRGDGGNMGRILFSSLPPALATAVKHLKSGVSPPVAALGRWYLLKASGLQLAGVRPFASVRVALQAELTRQKRAKALVAWLGTARKAAVITLA